HRSVDVAQEDDGDGIAGSNGGVAGNHGEAVGGNHGAEDARALIAGEARAIAAGAVCGQSDAQVSATSAGIRDGRLSAGLYQRPVERGVTAETAESGADEELEGDHRRDGIARESEDGQRGLAGGRKGG